MYILLAGLNHRTAPVEVRERFAICGIDLDDSYNFFKQQSDVEGSVILTTCNRTEIYATARDIEAGMEILLQFLERYSKMNREELRKYLYQPTCYDAMLHLFRVASGLDSMILGESQIISQVREAHQKAMECKASDSVLNTLFQKAVHVGKLVRSETGIDMHPVSVSHAAVDLAQEVLGSLDDKSILVVGAGEMSELTTRYLMSNGVKSVIVSNRSFDRAEEMAEQLGGRAVRFEQLATELEQADIVISCTAANHYVLHPGNCYERLASRNGRRIIMIDIAVPRDIEPSLKEIPGVYIFDIDDLQNVIDRNFLERQKAALEADKIIADELVKFNEWLGCLYVVPVITALKTRGEAIKQQELRKALNRLGRLSEREQNIVSTMAHAIVNQLLHDPIVNLKEMAVSQQGHLYAEVVKKLFTLSADLGEYENDEEVEVGHQR
ncbi:MAG TPA: glutamyl-tRNA reductase [Syntrophomonadaceae bacterium]|nr:glutamyl-tRNA reductase [Syntrophomonadaceae bacterium]